MLKLTGKEREISTIYLISKAGDIGQLPLTPEEKRFCLGRFEQKEKYAEVAHLPNWIYVVVFVQEEDSREDLESLRRSGSAVNNQLQCRQADEVQIVDYHTDSAPLRALLEGLILSNYRFDKYLTREDILKKNKMLTSYTVISKNVMPADLEAWQNILDGVYYARDLVNEPVSFLNAVQLSKEIERLGKASGFTVEVLHKPKIESLRMGGLLAVNRGSIDPPTFSILEWNPVDAVNKDPYVIIGKGVVFDTGGLSLKPTKDSMDTMKSDMGGGAAVVGSMYAIAKNKIPVHVIGLVPATDNRPDGNAYTPGDVITMMDGSTVEVLNTDAEGRMILADALTYAKRYNPELIIELSTLTGAAAMAIGPYGIVGMGNAPDAIFERLIGSGENVWERVVRFPFWKEYEEMLRSDIADLKNIGGSEGGAITAGKFLEHFTEYPYIHLDIAGPAFLQKAEHYNPKGGTGVGVRLLYHFIGESI
ncbi:MAG: leucyl aminopeptidase [Chlorobi bacterium]|nr:leucyl aminopeptidase [Chlorobiota bacterium]